MQTPFYASGFLYNHKTQQILLIQPETNTDAPTLWSTLGGDGMEQEEAQATFQRVVSNLLNINLNPKNVYPIYDYFHDGKNQTHFVFYAEVGSNRSSANTEGLSWFTFSEILKLKFHPQTKQDLMVGERVINAKWRDDEAKRESSVIGA